MEGDRLDEESSVGLSEAGTGGHFERVAESEPLAEWDVSQSDLAEKVKFVLESEFAKENLRVEVMKSGLAVDAKESPLDFSGLPHMVDGRYSHAEVDDGASNGNLA